MQSKISPQVVRKPTGKFSGDFFSVSMPASQVPREPAVSLPISIVSVFLTPPLS